LLDREIYFLENAKQYYKIAFAQIVQDPLFGVETQRCWMGKQYDNNDIPVTIKDDFLIFISRFGEKEGNYFQTILDEDEAEKYMEAAKDVYKIKKEIDSLWVDIRKVKLEKDDINIKIKQYFSQKKVKYGESSDFGEKLVSWSKKIEALRELFASGKHKIHNLNDKMYEKVQKLSKNYKPSWAQQKLKE